MNITEFTLMHVPDISASEVRRFIKQGALRLNGIRIRDINYEVDPPDVLYIKIGKKIFGTQE